MAYIGSSHVCFCVTPVYKMHPIPNPYAKTKLSALLHSYSVLKLCTYANYLPLKTIAKHHELLRPILKHTLFKKFAGAENLVELTSLKTELNGRGIKCILDLAIEADLGKVCKAIQLCGSSHHID